LITNYNQTSTYRKYDTETFKNLYLTIPSWVFSLNDMKIIDPYSGVNTIISTLDINYSNIENKFHLIEIIYDTFNKLDYSKIYNEVNRLRGNFREAEQKIKTLYYITKFIASNNYLTFKTDTLINDIFEKNIMKFNYYQILKHIKNYIINNREHLINIIMNESNIEKKIYKKRICCLIASKTILNLLIIFTILFGLFVILYSFKN
jgi:hypothetical protein